MLLDHAYLHVANAAEKSTGAAVKKVKKLLEEPMPHANRFELTVGGLQSTM